MQGVFVFKFSIKVRYEVNVYIISENCEQSMNVFFSMQRLAQFKEKVNG